jgi:hypothetical protein
MDPGRTKNKSSRNQTKPVPLRRARRANFSHILFSKWTLYVKVITFWSISQTGKKVNWSKSTVKNRTADVSMTCQVTSAWCHDDVSRDTWKHKEVTCVTHFWHFQAWCGPVKKWHMSQYEGDTWHCTDVTRGCTNTDVAQWQSDTWQYGWQVAVTWH